MPDETSCGVNPAAFSEVTLGCDTAAWATTGRSRAPPLRAAAIRTAREELMTRPPDPGFRPTPRSFPGSYGCVSGWLNATGKRFILWTLGCRAETTGAGHPREG